ncbi:hypothetical protein PC112_g15588 [Phytophthora cactorum]|nr:hypothetical protein PC112_g15588 [Phytophthora cactorum]KAG3147872.1 hypothetical protein C6341_g17583 [Phytophthora cactorum]
MAKFKLDKLTGAALLSHPNYKYYKNYVKNHLKAWATNGESLDDVAVWLGLENLQGKMLEAHPNFVFLKKYWTTSTKYTESSGLCAKILKHNDLPRMTRKDATPEELQEKTFIWTSMRRPECCNEGSKSHWVKH